MTVEGLKMTRKMSVRDSEERLLGTSREAVEAEKKPEDDMETGAGIYPVAFRTTLAFWILGLCNNYGYVVMLSAAVDIINRVSTPDQNTTNSSDSNPRSCNEMSTGAVLLADIIPALVIKVVAPFFPLWIHFRMLVVIACNVAGFVMVSQATTMAVALGGVVAIACASGLGEVSLLAYQSFYKNRSVISAWSSGTGGAGFFGSLSYMLLSYLSGDNKSDPLLIFLIVPTLLAISFWLVLEKPVIPVVRGSIIPDVGEAAHSTVAITPAVPEERSLSEKLAAIPKVLKYMVPFALVYLFEYFINQGLHELIHFNFPALTFANQYVSYQLCYQIGVFFSRSSINLFRVHNTWLLALLQGINVAVFATEAIFAYIPHIAIVWALIIWEGLLGGLTYVNTYDRINRQVPVEDRQFFMSLNSFGDAVGISLAGVIAIPVHNLICDMPLYGQ